MARSEARIFTTIWQDIAFLGLSEGAQRLYLFLLSQPDLSHCGLIALRERRWARSAAGLTASRVTAGLKELGAARFVVVDEDTEEVLIRSLIRRDGIWKQPNVMKSAREAAQLIESPDLRVALLEELRRIPAEEASELARRVLSEFMADLAKGSGNPSPNPSGNPYEKRSGESTPAPSGAPSQGKGEGYGGYVEASPLPGIPSPPPPSAGADAQRHADIVPIGEPTITQRSKKLTDAYYAAEPMCNWNGVNQIVIKAIKANKWTDQEIRDALLRLAADNRGVSVEKLRYELAPPAPSGRSSPPQPPRSTTDERVEQAQRLKAEFAAMQQPPTIRGEVAR